MSAIELNARASSHFAEKLAEAQALLQRAAKEFSPVTQASSLGAEDVVITHLINHNALNILNWVGSHGRNFPECLLPRVTLGLWNSS
jgi:phosphoadenosine phosphosulfate reductase